MKRLASFWRASNKARTRLAFILAAVAFTAFFASDANAQTKTIVSATVLDPNGVPYAGGSVATQLVPTSGTPTINKVPVNVQNNPAAIDANGHFTISLWCNTAGGACTPLDQTGTQWQFTITNPGAQPPVGFGGVSFTLSVTITGTTQDLSSTLSAASVPLYRDGASAGGCTVGGAAGNLLYVNSGVTGCANTNKMNYASGSDTLTLTPANQTFTATALALTGSSTYTETVGTAAPVTPGSVTQRSVTGTTDTILSTDRQNRVVYNSASAVAVSLPANGTSGLSGGFNFRISNQNTGAVTVTPAAGLINGNATLVLNEGDDCFVTPSSPPGTNYAADCNPAQIAAGAGISLTRGVHSLTIAATGLQGITFPQTVAGTVTSGGVPYFNSTTQMSSSALLAANGVLLGGGAGNPPVTNAGLAYSAGTLTCGIPTTNGCVITGAGATSGTASITWPAVAGTTSNAILLSNSIKLPAGTAANTAIQFPDGVNYGFFDGAGNVIAVANGHDAMAWRDVDISAMPSQGNLCWTATSGDPTAACDTNISRTAAATVSVGNGTAANATGTLIAATIRANTGFNANGTAGISSSGVLCTATFTSVEGLVTACTAVSDPLLKTNIHPFLRGLSDIEKIHPIAFNYNAEGRKITGIGPDVMEYGFSAKDIQLAIPEAVGTEAHDGSSYLSLPQGDRPILAALVNAVKEQQEQIRSLKLELAKRK